MASSEKDKICETLGLIAALISGAGIAIAVFQQINGCSCSQQEQPPENQGIV